MVYAIYAYEVYDRYMICDSMRNLIWDTYDDNISIRLSFITIYRCGKWRYMDVWIIDSLGRGKVLYLARYIGDLVPLELLTRTRNYWAIAQVVVGGPWNSLCKDRQHK